MMRVPSGLRLPAGPRGGPPSGPPPTPPGLGASGESELFVVTSNGPLADPGLIASTSKLWRACDVYVTVQPSAASINGTLSFFIFAVTRGVRALVASGRISLSPQSGEAAAPSPTAPVWVAAARCGASSFEVVGTFSNTHADLNPSVVNMTISVIASNVDAPPQEDVGALPMGLACGQLTGPLGKLGLITVVGQTLPLRMKLLGVCAVNGAAAARFLHVHDTTDGTVALGGLTPLWIYPMGAAIGAGIVDRSFRYRAQGALQIVPSSTLSTTTIVADCALQAWVQ